MSGLWSIHTITSLEPLLYCVLLTVLLCRRQVRKFRMLATLTATKLLSWCMYVILLFAVAHLGAPPIPAYQDYFYFYWLSFAVEAILSLGIVFELYHLAMVPLPGLQRLGRLMFRWAGCIAVAIAFGLAVGSHVSGKYLVVHAVLQLQQTGSILALCLLLFVTFAIRPMGLSYRSRIFGVGFGLGILSVTDLMLSAWSQSASDLRATVNVVAGLSMTLAFLIWITYFAMPDPKRQLIVLPTTSPFLRWNQIALALGDAPGYVAIGGIDPAFLAPAEVEIMERTSVKLKGQATRTASLLDRAQPEWMARAN